VDEELPDEVRRFVVANISSVSELEALLLLRASAEREWSANEVGHRLFIQPAQAKVLLVRLCDKGLLSKREANYRYAADPALDARVAVVAETHARQLVPLTKLIHSLSASDARQFSDAFRFRKDDK